ncbi:MAG TPA: DUF6675 family protein [Terriglobales bacterium]|nr:DUF6675 family protein [Terriglobales bacterium]
MLIALKVGARIRALELLAALAGTLLLAGTAPAASAKMPPMLPCGGEPYPPFAEDVARPNVQVWTRSDLPSEWSVPACAGVNATAPYLMVALAGVFHDDTPMNSLAGRFGTISATKGIKYWSVTDKAWRVLITDATALTAAGKRRPDFAAADVISGADLYFEQQDNRSSRPVIYRMHIGAFTPDRIEVSLENVTAVRVFGISVFDPGDLKSLYILQRSSGGWSYYSLSIMANPGLWGSGSQPSFVNRAAAFYRHFIGLPTDQEPPAAP